MKKALVVLIVLLVCLSFASNGTKINFPLGDRDDLYRDYYSSNGMVSSAKPGASLVGVEVLKNGGNAVDAAVATAFALGVLEPNASGLGGGGFMIIHSAETGEDVVIDFREIAPAAATADMYKDYLDNFYDAYFTPLSSGVPGELAGLNAALEMYGTMSLEDVITPSIKLLEEGIPVTDNLSGLINTMYDAISLYPESLDVWCEDWLPYGTGDVIYNDGLKNSLELISENGIDVFYNGEIGEALVSAAQKYGGIITMDDLRNYEVQIRKPVYGNYRGYDVISVPPASSGGTIVIEILNILENYDFSDIDFGSTEYYHIFSEAMKLAYADRSQYMADTAFTEVPLEGLTSKEYAYDRFSSISMTESNNDPLPGDPFKYESGNTTSLSVMDKEGNAVTITKSNNFHFGCGLTIPGYGFVLNNHMLDFVPVPGSENSIEPGKRPLSSMSPTIVMDGNLPFLTLGSPGGTRIISAVVSGITNVIDYGMELQEAILAPRVCNRNNYPLQLEARVDEEVLKELENMGHEIQLMSDYDPSMGSIQAVQMLPNMQLHGGSDPRRDGQSYGF